MSILKDHIVSFRREEVIEDGAKQWLRLHFTKHPGAFNIVHFIEDTLLRHLPKEKGAFVVFLDAPDPSQPPAYVRFDPFELHVDETVWERAKSGDQNAEFILAHEIGHMTLHDQMAQAFSSDLPTGLGSYAREQSAEWQANIFASAFQNAARKLEALDYSGDACGRCGNFTMAHSDNCLKCTTCRWTTRCS